MVYSDALNPSRRVRQSQPASQMEQLEPRLMLDAAPQVILDIDYYYNAGSGETTFAVYATTSPGDNAGIVGFNIPISNIDSAEILAPYGYDEGASVYRGFDFGRASLNGDGDLFAARLNASILYGVGQTGGTMAGVNIGDPDVVWTVPVLLASGVYSGVLPVIDIGDSAVNVMSEIGGNPIAADVVLLNDGDVDPVPRLTLSSTAYSVGEDGVTATITVNRLGDTTDAVSVDYSTTDVSATAGVDYTATGGTLNWDAGDSDAKTFTVSISDDTDYEVPDETFNVTLSNATAGVVLGTSSATVTIEDDDPLPSTLTFSSSTYSVGENCVTATITVNRLGGTDGAVSVDYSTIDDSALAGVDYEIAGGTLNWADGDSAAKTFEITISDDIVYENPDETFNVALSNATAGVVLGTDSAIVTIEDDDEAYRPLTEADLLVGDAVSKAIIYTDTDGTLVTVSLRGGTSQLEFSSNDLTGTLGRGGLTITSGPVELMSIELQDTTSRSSLTIKTKGGDGFADVGEITGSTPLGKLLGKTVDLSGDGIDLTGDGYIGSIQIHDLTAGADIIMPGADATTGITIAAGELSDGTDITLGSYLKSLKMVTWAGGELTAPWVSAITVSGLKGNARNSIDPVAGDLAANITADDVDPRSGLSLGKLTVVGSIIESDIDLAGAAGSITAAEWVGGSLTATLAKSVSIKGNRNDPDIAGDLNADITLTDQDAKGVSLAKLSVVGTIVGADIDLAGAAGSITAGEWVGGSLTATLAKSVSIKGNRNDPNIDGDLNADITLTGQDPRSGLSLGKLTVAGTALNSIVRTNGSMGALTLGASQGSDFLAGISDLVSRHAASADDFEDVTATIKSVKIKGWRPAAGDATPRFLADSNFSAASLGLVSLLNIEYDNTEEAFGLYALDQGTGKEIRSVSGKDTVSGERWKWPVMPVGADDFEVSVIEVI